VHSAYSVPYGATDQASCVRTANELGAVCGRYSFFARRAEVSAAFPFARVDDDFDRTVPQRYNIAPTQAAPVVLSTGRCELLTWGFGLPHTFNARAESIAQRPLYRAAFEGRRALALASNWYEWEPTPSGKRPFAISLQSGAPFAFAAIWEERDDRACFSILTRASRGILARVHHREPIVLLGERARRWIAADCSPRERDALIEPREPNDEIFVMHEVGREVNDVGNDEPSLIAPLSAQHASRELRLL